MGYLSSWQPLVDENAHTALTFGFLRHAPAEAGLEPWLSEVMGKSVTAAPLGIEHFWPSYPSVFAGQQTTEPELVFPADDGKSLMVVIEAKPGYGQQRKEQVSREIIDTAHATGATRIACIMIGADLGPPMSLPEWHQHVVHDMEAHGLLGVESELHYASWASLGHAARACGLERPDWKRYAEDLVEQLRTNVLMGYDGAPSLDDMEGQLTLGNAAEAFRRTIEAGRQLFLALHSQDRFRDLGLRSYWDSGHRLLRDGFGESPTSGAEYFQTTVLIALYRLPTWPRNRVVFAGVYLGNEEAPELNVGLGDLAEQGETIVYRWAHADEPEAAQPLGILAKADRAAFPHAAIYLPGATWLYDTEPWVPGRAHDDLSWIAGKLEAATRSWNEIVGDGK